MEFDIERKEGKKMEVFHFEGKQRISLRVLSIVG